MVRTRRLLTALAVLVLVVGFAGTAQAAVSVTRAAVSGTTLKIEGRAAANRAIAVDGVRMATSSSSGSFKISRTSYIRPADCTVNVNDGSATAAVVTLSGCTVTAPHPSSAPAVSSVTMSHVSLGKLGDLAVGDVQLVSAATAPGTVSLTSSHPVIAPVHAASVPVAAGSAQAVFTVTYTTAVTTPTVVTISATAGGVTRTTALTINPPPTFGFASPTITLGPGFVGTSFVDTANGTTIGVAGRVGCISFDVVAGQLPAGLSLTDPNLGSTPCKLPSVAVVGVPITVGTSTFTVRATDAAKGATATTVVTITIQPPLGLAINAQLPWAPVVGAFSNLWIDGAGGVMPYTWVRTAGVLPPGMTLVQDNRNGPLVRVTGTPTAAGTFTFTLRLTDATGATGVKTISVTVATP